MLNNTKSSIFRNSQTYIFRSLACRSRFKSLVKLFIFIIISAILISGCNVYSPPSYIPVLTDQKGEVSIAGSVIASSSTIGVTGSITGAITDRIAIQGNIASTKNHLRILNGNVSYLFSKEDRFKVRGQLGYASYKLDSYHSSRNDDVDRLKWIGDLKLPYVASQLAYSHENSAIGITLKAGKLYPNLNKETEFLDFTTSNEFINQRALILEPSVFVSDKLGERFQYVASITKTWLFPLDRSSNRRIRNVEYPFLDFILINVGISYDLVKYKDKGTKE